jgi:hypothetical protein
VVALNLTQANIQTALRTFLVGVLPSGVEVFEGQDNRVPEPLGDNFVIFTPIGRDRFSTNVDTFQDCAFTASIAGQLLNVQTISIGAIANGATVFGSGVAPGTSIASQVSGSLGGTGVYQLDGTTQIAPLQGMAAGSATVLESVHLTFQIDVHGSLSSDYAQIISTMFRDDLGVQLFQSSGFDVVPLYADQPRQSPFINAENQVEYRWTIDAEVQANQVVIGLPMQFWQSFKVNVHAVTGQGVI